MVAIRGRTFKKPWQRSCLSSKLKSSSAPIGREDSWCFHAVGSSNAPLLGSTAAEGLPRIGRTSIATHWRFCGLPQSASCSENFVIPPDVFGQTLSLLLLAAPAAAQPSYTAPAEFMNLFFDFTGSNEPGYPAGQPTLGQMLTHGGIAKEGGARGPLVLVVGSDIYVYASSGGARLAHERFRADRASGFYELTAISHIGPALAYLAQIKANGDPRWRARLAALQTHVAQVRALNERAADNWLDRLNQPAWSARKAQI